MTVVAINMQVRGVILLFRSVCTQCLPIAGQNGIHSGQGRWKTYLTRVIEYTLDKGDGKHIGQGRWNTHETRAMENICKSEKWLILTGVS